MNNSHTGSGETTYDFLCVKINFEKTEDMEKQHIDHCSTELVNAYDSLLKHVLNVNATHLSQSVRNNQASNFYNFTYRVGQKSLTLLFSL